MQRSDHQPALTRDREETAFDSRPAGRRTSCNNHAIELAQLRWLEIASTIEASTLLLLLGIAVPLKHLEGWAMGVRIMRPVHGLALVASIWSARQTVAGDAGGWTRRERTRLFALAFIPFGGFCNFPMLARKAGMLRDTQSGA